MLQGVSNPFVEEIVKSYNPMQGFGFSRLPWCGNCRSPDVCKIRILAAWLLYSGPGGGNHLREAIMKLSKANGIGSTRIIKSFGFQHTGTFVYFYSTYTIYPLYDGSQSVNTNQLEVGSWKNQLPQHQNKMTHGTTIVWPDVLKEVVRGKYPSGARRYANPTQVSFLQCQ